MTSVTGKHGYFVLESDKWREDRIYDPEIVIQMGAPRIPAPGETLIFKAKAKD